MRQYQNLSMKVRYMIVPNRDQLKEKLWKQTTLSLVIIIHEIEQSAVISIIPPHRIIIKKISSFAVFWPSPCQSKLVEEHNLKEKGIYTNVTSSSMWQCKIIPVKQLEI